MKPSTYAFRKLVRLVSFSLVILAIETAWIPLAYAQLPAESRASSSIPGFSMGFDGLWKVGFETVARVDLPTDALKTAQRIQLVTVDGDGVPVRYDFPVEMSRNLIVRHGRMNRAIRVETLNERGQIDYRYDLSDTERGKALPVAQPWVLALGNNLKLDEIVLQSARGGLPSISISQVSDASLLPTNALGYGGVDRVVLATDDLNFLSSIAPEQGAALQTWVAQGGDIQLWLGKSGLEAGKLPWLQPILPGEVLGVESNVNPALLESYVATSQTARLNEFDATVIKPRLDVNVDLTLETRDRSPLPLLLRSVYGAGRVDTIATDLNSESMLAWKDRRHLLERIFGIEFTDRLTKQKSDSTSYLGFNEISGQIRSSLDLFDNVSSGSIGLISALIILFVLIVGVFDYFVTNKALRRSSWTWLTLLLSSGLLLAFNQTLTSWWKPQHTAINSVEIIDYYFDLEKAHGTSFTHQYSGVASQMNLVAEARSFNATDDKLLPPQRSYLRWAGQPGSGLGGFDSQVRTDLGMPPYRISSELNSHSIESEIIGVGIPTAGTIALRASWDEDCKGIKAFNRLQNVAGSDFIEGSFTNPLQVDLKNAVLYYEAWAYSLPTRIPSGESIKLDLSSTPRDLSRQLQRKRVVGDSEQSIPWNPLERRDMNRLIELLSFYEGAGGKRYVGLDLNYLKQFDLSQRLSRGRAVILAQVDESALKWKTRKDDQSVVNKDGYRSTYVRFLLPVEDR